MSEASTNLEVLFEPGSLEALVRRLDDARDLILRETANAAGKVSMDELSRLGAILLGRTRTFLIGEGRSGLVGRMFAMRLMHLGRTAYVVGETTTPALESGDLLVAISGSGSSGFVQSMAAKARTIGVVVVAVTTDGQSPLAQVADHVVLIPAAAKQDQSGKHSHQFAGSLFEQTCLLTLDALFLALSQATAQSVNSLWARHTNLE